MAVRGIAGTGPEAPTAVDVALVLAIDSSGSISEQRLALQILGYAQALRSPAVLRAIHAGPHARIEVAIIGWSTWDRQDELVGWTAIDDIRSANVVADILLAAPKPSPGYTSISGAIDAAAARLAGRDATRRVIDVSGDGANNDGRPVTEARDDAVAAGITINGLPIIEVDPDLDAYYRANVIGGHGAFATVAKNIDSFAEAVLRKLIAEIAGLPPDEFG